MAVAIRPTAIALLILGSLLFPASSSAAGRHRFERRVFVPVLTFHHVKWLKQSDNQIERGLTVSPPQFESYLRYLELRGYHAITASKLVSYLRGDGTLPSRSIVLTFDDGYADMCRYAVPILRRHHMIATFFVVPGLLNRARYLSWNQVHYIDHAGMDVQAHSMTHPDLTTVGPAQLQEEVSDSRRQLQLRLQKSVRIFAYPYGAFDERVKRAVRRAGFEAAFTTHQGWFEDGATPLELPRIYVDLDDTTSIFAGRVTADPSVLSQDPT